jgi:hypothetical protein
VSAHVSERISAYIDRELSASERAAVDAHLRDCADCARTVEELRAVDALARDHEVAEPAGYFEALPARLRGRLAPAPRTRVPAWALALAAGLAVAVLAPLALRHSPAPRPSIDEAASRPAAPLAAPSAAPRREAAPGPAAPAPAPLERRFATPPAPPRAVPPPEGPPPPLVTRAEPQGGRATPAGEAAGQAVPRAREEAEAAAALSGRDAASPAEAARRTPAALPPTAPAAEAVEGAEAEEEEDATPLVSDDSAPPRKAAGAVAGAAAPRAGGAPASPGADARLRSLSSRTMRSAADARALRDAWLAFVREDPDGPHADDARLRALEAGAAAWRLGGLRDDRTQVDKDAREYLRRPDGAHKERVRALLAGLDP